MTPRPSRQQPSAAANTATTTATTAAAKGPLAPVVYSAGNELAAEALAADLVSSLSELLVREKTAAVAAAAGVGEEAAEAAAWSSMWEKLTGVPLEGLVANAGHATTVTAAVNDQEDARSVEAPALVRKPCDSHTLTTGGGGKEEGLGSTGRRLRGEPLSSLVGAAGVAARAGGDAASFPTETRRLFEKEKGEGMLAGVPGTSGVGGGEGFDECVGTVGEEDFLKIESTWLNMVLTAICVVCAGLAAGLTMGLLSIEPLEMAIKQRSGKNMEGMEESYWSVCSCGTYSVPFFLAKKQGQGTRKVGFQPRLLRWNCYRGNLPKFIQNSQN